MTRTIITGAECYTPSPQARFGGKKPCARLQSAMPLSERLQQEILNLSRAYIRRALGLNDIIPTAQEPEIRQPAGCFVSLHSLHGHRLRGCVGRIDASQPLIVALESASKSVLEDTRFARALLRS